MASNIPRGNCNECFSGFRAHRRTAGIHFGLLALVLTHHAHLLNQMKHSYPPDPAPVLHRAIFSVPIIIPFKYLLWVLLESLLYGVLLLHFDKDLAAGSGRADGGIDRFRRLGGYDMSGRWGDRSHPQAGGLRHMGFT